MMVALMNQADNLKEEMSLIYDTLKTTTDCFDDFYDASRGSYVNFVDFAPSIQQQMKEVE